jgi:peptidoglycan/xylan/chitin deacetylase (PgdA/CDA1 family)
MSTDISGTTHTFYPRQPIVTRASFRWPNGARVAVAFVISAEYYEMQIPANAYMPPNLPGGFGKGPYPDFRTYSSRGYGSRVGIFRIFEALDRHQLKATVALDALTVQDCARLIPHILKRGYEIAGHGQSINRMISSKMTEEEEREYIATTLAALENGTGVRPRGWHGPEYGESFRTPRLLAELGLTYVLDWPNDEQPVMFTTPHGPLVSVPMLIDFDDVYAQFHRKITAARWAQSIEEGIDTLLLQPPDAGRMLVINLHPWLMGHPFRIGHLERALSAITKRQGIWFTTAGQIADWSKSQA